MGSYVDQADHGILIVYENDKIPRFVRETYLDLATDMLTTRALLELAERRGVVASADACWQRILEVVPTADPDINIMMHRRPRA